MSATSLDVKFGSADFLADPWRYLEPIQAAQPLFWSEANAGWVVSRYEDIVAGYADDRLSNARMIGQVFASMPPDIARQLPNFTRYIPLFANFADKPLHTRLRKAMVQALDRRRVEKARASTRQFIGKRLAALPEAMPVDFVSECAWKIPPDVVLKLLGVDDSESVRYSRWAREIIGALGAAAQSTELLIKAEQSFQEMNEALIPLLEERRRNPRDDLISSIAQADGDPTNLSLDEMLGCLHMFITGGLDTTVHLMGMTVYTLAQRPELLEYVRRNPEKVREFGDEFLRYTGVLKAGSRVALEDIDWHGLTIAKGDVVYLMNVAANRDPRQWSDGDKLDPGRDNAESFVFAPGIHHCIGHLLAKMELDEFLLEFSQTIERVELVGDSIEFVPNFVLRGPRELDIRLHRIKTN